LPSDVRLFCYSKEEDASLGQNSLENHYTSVSKTLIRAENDEGCYGTGQFDIIVEPIPKSKLLKKEFSVTDRAFPSFWNRALFPALTADYAYAWSTGETTHSIEVSKRRRLYSCRDKRSRLQRNENL
jgi:hypothetical protein